MTEEKSDKGQKGMSGEAADKFIIAAMQAGKLSLPHIEAFEPDVAQIKRDMQFNATQLTPELRTGIQLDAQLILTLRQALMSGL